MKGITFKVDKVRLNSYLLLDYKSNNSDNAKHGNEVETGKYKADTSERDSLNSGPHQVITHDVGQVMDALECNLQIVASLKMYAVSSSIPSLIFT